MAVYQPERWEFRKENKKVTKQELDPESDQEKKKTRTRPRNDQNFRKGRKEGGREEVDYRDAAASKI